MPDNNAQILMDQFIDQLNNLTRNNESNIYQILELKRKLEEILKDFPIQEVRDLKKIYEDNNDEIRNVFANVINSYSTRMQAEEEYTARIRQIQDEIADLTNAMNEASEDEKKYYQDRINSRRQQLDEEQRQHQAEVEGRSFIYRQQREIEEEHNRDLEERNQRSKEMITSLIDTAGKVGSALLSQVTGLLSTSIDKITNVYEQNAGTLSAALDLTVDDISDLQHKIANQLQDESLGKAISNIAVMTEMSSLTSAGYTNTDRLEETATSITIGREIAPNLNFDTSQVRYLTNVFGNDFITRFAAIQAAVQETAGATVGLRENLTTMMQDLEPVYENAQYSLTAMESTADVQATLSAAIDAGVINESQAQEYLSMITELMDPSKAFTSKSTAVRVAATTYDFGSGDPLQALEALLSARGQMYGNVSMNNDYWGVISRSLTAGAYGDNTMNAAYMQSGLYGLDILKTGDLESYYDDRLSSLESGDYTTKREENEASFENSSIAQALADASKYAPMIYSALSGSILIAINTLPIRIANAINSKISLGSLFGGGSGGTGSLGQRLSGGAGGAGSGGVLGSLGSALNTFGRGSTAAGVFRAGGIAAGVLGGINLISNVAENGANIQGFGFEGNYLESALSYGGIGAAIGSIFGPLGTAIGAGVGAIAGLTTAALANKDAQEENTRAIEASIQNTKDVLGEGVTPISTMDQYEILAKGGGIAHLSSGDYEIASSTPRYALGLDYVPYDDMLVRLHKGESVVTADVADRYRSQDPDFYRRSSLRMNSDDDIVGALNKQTESIVNAVNGEQQYAPLTTSGPKQYVIVNTNR